MKWFKHTIFSIPFAHTLVRAAAAEDRADNAVHIGGATPFLVREDVDPHHLLSPLDEVHISQHAIVFEFARKFTCHGSIRVETGEGDQLKGETRDS